jgi:hypothetical protein
VWSAQCGVPRPQSLGHWYHRRTHLQQAFSTSRRVLDTYRQLPSDLGRHGGSRRVIQYRTQSPTRQDRGTHAFTNLLQVCTGRELRILCLLLLLLGTIVLAFHCYCGPRNILSSKVCGWASAFASSTVSPDPTLSVLAATRHPRCLLPWNVVRSIGFHYITYPDFIIIFLCYILLGIWRYRPVPA